MKTLRKCQKGFSLVTAIFLLVVMGGLSAVMMTLFTAQQQTATLDILGTRAYQAARAGIEWGAYEVLRDSAGTFSTGCLAGSTSQSLAAGTLGGSLGGFAVSVNCVATVHNDVGAASGVVSVFNLTSTATQGTAGQADYVERQVNVTLAQ